MNRILTIAGHEYVTNVKRPGFIFFTLIVPALGLVTLIVAAFFSGQAARFFENQFSPEANKVGMVDQSGVVGSIPLEYADRFVLMPDEDSAKQALQSGQVGSFLVIPRDYVSTGKVTAYSKGGFSGAALQDSNTLRAFLVQRLLQGKVSPEVAARAAQPVNLEPVTLDAKGQPTSGGGFSFIASFLAPYFLSVFLVVSIFVSSSYLLRSVSEEKETRVIEIVLSSVSATELLAGKVIGLGALGLTQVGVWLLSVFVLNAGSGALIAGGIIALAPMTFVLAAIYFLLGYLVFAIVMAAAGALGTNMRESQQLAGIFSFMAAVPYMLAGFLFANPNALLARILSYFPLTAPTMMMLRLPLGEVPTVDIIGSIVVLLISIPVLLWAGAKLFRMGLLLYGQRPSMREMVRVLRAA